VCVHWRYLSCIKLRSYRLYGSVRSKIMLHPLNVLRSSTFISISYSVYNFLECFVVLVDLHYSSKCKLNRVSSSRASEQWASVSSLWIFLYCDRFWQTRWKPKPV
jgi:hypothetical protein